VPLALPVLAEEGLTPGKVHVGMGLMGLVGRNQDLGELDCVWRLVCAGRIFETNEIVLSLAPRRLL
jgi:hypothetical protein